MNAKTGRRESVYCKGVSSENLGGEQWIPCPSPNQMGHEECVDGGVIFV